LNRRFRMALVILVALFASGTPSASAERKAQPLTIDNVLDIVALDRVAIAPDGEWIAAVVQRPARAGEAFGRTSYETDPSRSDVWLISRRTGERRNITNGATQAAGFWCATWSPDGTRLAMLSTMPEGSEPRGGDNVRLYVWERSTGILSRLGNAPVMTQTRYGSPMYWLDVRAPGSSAPARCGGGENAPYIWLDGRRLLAALLPEDALSGLFEEYSRPALHGTETLEALRGGLRPTASSSNSGTDRPSENGLGRTAIVRTIDVESRAAGTVGTVPIYPFRGDLSLSVSPDGRRIAILATRGMIEPEAAWRFPHQDGSWWSDKRLAFAELSGGAELRWLEAPPAARFPLELLAWSPDSKRVALRARSSGKEAGAALFLASARDLSIVAVGPKGAAAGLTAASANYTHEAAAFWIDGRRLVARLRPKDAARPDWWLVGEGMKPVNLTSGAAESPEAIRQGEDGDYYAVSGRQLMRLDVARRALTPVAGIPLPEGVLVGPNDASRRIPTILVAGESKAGSRTFHEVPLARAARPGRQFQLPDGSEIIASDPATGLVLSLEAGARGTFLRATDRGGPARELLALNQHLADVDWGGVRLIDYRNAGGEALQGAVILPPGYRPEKRYPTLVWVYGGYRVRGLDSYFLMKQMPGFYNLYLYAARGYVVLIPSMPLNREGGRNDSYADLPGGVLPAVQRLVDLGIADQDRVGVFGQSFGGYSVYGLVSQTQRFRAAVAMAGITDLPTLYGHFDPAARGYPGIEHEKSENWAIVQMGQWGIDARPDQDPERFRRNSPIDHVDRVQTPLLMIHGEYDKRGQMSQAEAFFYALYREGKQARLLRYWGESHSLAQSPANVRNIYEETMAWFDRYLTPRAAEPH
jgi:dipeptidyl aminopeptidase/acylaminoacyl peptidase